MVLMHGLEGYGLSIMYAGTPNQGDQSTFQVQLCTRQSCVGRQALSGRPAGLSVRRQGLCTHDRRDALPCETR